MTDIFQLAARPNQDLFFKKNDANDVRLGEIVSSKTEDYTDSEIVILGCPQDEGVSRNKGRTGAAFAPDAIRTQFYKLSNFGISRRIFDIGNTTILENLEETHEIHTQIVKRILKDGKKIIVLGGGNDISYADGKAMAEVFGAENWIGINIDAHFDVRADFPRNSGTPYRQLLEEKLIKPANFYEFAWQPQVNSPVYFEHLQNLRINLTSLEEVQNLKLSIQDILKNQIDKRDEPKNIFFGFDVDSVRASDAPGVSAPSPLGLTAEEFIESAKFAGENRRTRIIEFTEANPNFDIDHRTTKLVAAAVHKFCISHK
ncbi:MAG TPA: formimidoylglutamase [Pyrinomonadaceae bacterium]|nr:formimidoylglutamase [Pyrinomonadaceae bacterium]